MSEVVRFRLVRGPDRVIPASDELIRPTGDNTFLTQLADAGPNDRSALLRGASLVTDPKSLQTKLAALDEALAQSRNRLDPAAVTKIVGDPEQIVKSPEFQDDRARLMNTLGAIISGSETPSLAWQGQEVLELGARVQRMLYIAGLIELMARRPNPIKDATDVFNALRWRTITLPKGLWPSAQTGGRLESRKALGSSLAELPIYATSRRPAFADLYLVRQDWVRYEAGEIAHIENVVKGEHKEREHRRKTETEVTSFTQQELNTFDERDTQTTSRFDLSTETSREMELALHLDGAVDVKALAGPTTIAAHVGGSVDYSQSTADSTATSTSREAVDRAVKRIEARTLETRTARTLTTVEELNRHIIDNKAADAKNISAVYRWVNKINRMRVYRFPNRFLLEFQVPEPAAWWRWMQKGAAAALAPQAPTPFTTTGVANGPILGVENVTEQNYAQLGARYGVKAMPAPPAPILRPGANIGLPESAANELPVKFAQYDKLTVPDGYRAVQWSARVLTWHNGGYGNDGMQLQISVGGTSNGGVGAGKWESLVQQTGGDLPDLTGIVPIGVMADAPWGFELTFTLVCHRLDALMRKWQQSVYDMLVDGHAQMQEAYARALRGDDDSGITIQGDNPALNRQIVVTELKKHVTELLLERALVGVDAIDEDANTGEPSVNEQMMKQLSPIVSFMEQAFEWENLTYVFYPYFWSTRADWTDVAKASGADPEFAAFLSAGSARVIVPARPGLEQVVNFFLHTGIPWLGVQAPAPDEPGYLSIDKEIRALQLGAPDGVPVGDSWEVRLPTTLVWLQNDGTLPVNPAPTVPA
jgi:hypothetical protein